MRQTKRTIIGAAAFAASALVLAGCGQSTEASPASSSPTPLPTVTVSAEDQAIADAKEAYIRFVQVDAEIGSNLTNSLDSYDEVATGAALIDLKYRVSQQRDQTIYVTGPMEVGSIEQKKVSLEYDPNSDPPLIPFVTLRACVDLSAAKVHEESTGKIEEIKMPRQVVLVDVTNETGLLSDKGSWRVSYFKNEGSSC
jgi:hypothetical protein